MPLRARVDTSVVRNDRSFAGNAQCFRAGPHRLHEGIGSHPGRYLQTGGADARDMKPKGVQACLASLVIGLAVLAGCGRKTAPPHDDIVQTTAGGQLGADAAAVAQRLATLDASLSALEQGDREAPRDRWDPGFVVEGVGRDPAALRDWVRYETCWIPYRGALRGPVGVLMDRQGNSLDRALLLAALLREAGHEVRLARGELTEAQAMELLPLVRASCAAQHESPLDTKSLASEVRAAATKYGLDAKAIAARIAAREATAQRSLSSLEERIALQADRLLSLIERPAPRTDWARRYADASTALRDHWWVQRRQNGAWVDLDVMMLQAATGRPLVPAIETISPDDLRSDLQHELVIRVVAERATGQALAETRVMEHTLRLDQLDGASLVLQFWPGSWPAELNPDPDAPFGFRSAALEQTAWSVTLLKGKEVAAQTLLRSTDEGASPAASNPWAALGAGISGSASARPGATNDAAELTAVWIEYEMRAPGASPRNVRRTVFDLLGPAQRSAAANRSALSLDESQRLERNLSLMMRTEILPITARPSAEFITHLSAQSVLANRELLRTIQQLDSAQLEGPEIAQRLSEAPDGLSPLHAVSLGRFAWSGQSVFVDRANVLTRHQYPAAYADGLVLRDAVDIVANEVGVDLAEPDAFAVRVAQGVIDTNVETSLHVTTGRVANTADAFQVAGDWLSLTPATLGSLSRVDATTDALSSLRGELDQGLHVVAPRATVRSGAADYYGWWRIDPATGDTLGVSANGWGQAMAERGVQYNVLTVMARQFAFDYAFCQAVPQVANQAVNFLQQYRDELPPWLPPLALAKSSGQVYSENKKGCLIGAMIGLGVTATLPFLIATLKMSFRWWMALGVRGGGRIPPGWVEGMPIKGESGASSEAGAGSSAASGSGAAAPSSSGAPGSAGAGGSGASGAAGAGAPESAAGSGAASGAGSGAGARGPYQSDPVGTGLIRNNPGSDANALMGGDERLVNAIGAADAAAAREYADRVASGASDQLAHDYSRDVWQSTFNANSGRRFGVPVGGKTVDMGATSPDVGGTMSGGRPPPVYAPVRGGPSNPSPQSTMLVGLDGASSSGPFPWD
jgi:hypothetical protein